MNSEIAQAVLRFFLATDDGRMSERRERANVQLTAQISIQEIERDPLAFVHRIEAGEPVLAVRGGVAIAKVHPVPPAANQLRTFGLASGEFAAPDDFDGPLPDEMVSLGHVSRPNCT